MARPTAACRVRKQAGNRVKAQDALFLHVESPTALQHVGAVVTVTGSGVSLTGLRSAVASRVSEIPQLRRRVLAPSGRWSAARWVTDDVVDVGSRIRQITVGRDGWPVTTEQVAAKFFAEPMDPGTAPWQILLLRDAPCGPNDPRTTFIVKVHHALGDSYTLIAALSGLFDPAPPYPTVQRRYAAAARRPGIPELRAAVRTAVSALCGAVALALTGPARRSCLDGPGMIGGRKFATIRLPSRAFTILARRFGTNTSGLVLALVAEGIGELMAKRGQPANGRDVRVMVPLTARKGGVSYWPRANGSAPDHGHQRELPSNQAAGLLLDLPVEPMPLAERVTAIHQMWSSRLRRGDAQAAAVILRAMNVLPAPLQRAFARMSYCSSRFNMIVSIFPGIRQRRLFLGAEVTEVYPVLALADGVGMAIGAMTWGRSLSLGFLADEQLVPDLPLLVSAIDRSFAVHRAAMTADAQGRTATPGPRRASPKSVGAKRTPDR